MRQACPTRQLFAVPPPLEHISRPDCPIAQEPRQMSQPVKDAAARWVSHGPELFLSRGTVEIIETELQPVMPASTQPLVEDMLALARCYQQVAGIHELRFRLEKIDHDSCRRFHVDYVPLRLLCTYVGPGVQWRHASDQLVHKTPAGWLTLLKGKLYPGWEAERAVLHRSPPLSVLKAPVTRLLLTLDYVDACGTN
ncbi:MAG: DUF1826 domain-containing protein [Acetobacter papayae]